MNQFVPLQILSTVKQFIANIAFEWLDARVGIFVFFEALHRNAPQTAIPAFEWKFFSVISVDMISQRLVIAKFHRTLFTFVIIGRSLRMDLNFVSR